MVSFIDTFILGFALTVTIGPVAIETWRRGFREGTGEAVKVVVGTMIAELIFFSLTYFGLSFLAKIKFFNLSLGFLGFGFLTYLGFGNIRSYLRGLKNHSLKLDSNGRIYNNSYVAGCLINLLNPVAFFMWVAIIGSFFAQGISLFVASGVLFGVVPALLLFPLVPLFGRRFLDEKKINFISLLGGLFLIFYAQKLLFDLAKIL